MCLKMAERSSSPEAPLEAAHLRFSCSSCGDEVDEVKCLPCLHSLPLCSGGSRDPIRLVPRFPGILNEVLSGKGLSTVKSSVWISKTSIAIVTFLICASLHADGYHVILKLRCLNHGPYQLYIVYIAGN